MLELLLLLLQGLFVPSELRFSLHGSHKMYASATCTWRSNKTTRPSLSNTYHSCGQLFVTSLLPPSTSDGLRFLRSQLRTESFHGRLLLCESLLVLAQRLLGLGHLFLRPLLLSLRLFY